METDGSSESKANSQSLERRLNIWELKKGRLVWKAFVIEHEADAPYCRRETDILGAC